MERGEVPLLSMDKIFCLSMRGLNRRGKQLEIKSLNESHKSGLVALLETRIKPNKMGSLFLNLFKEWSFSSNSAWDDGGRIVIA